jgi:hypothetical protein
MTQHHVDFFRQLGGARHPQNLEKRFARAEGSQSRNMCSDISRGFDSNLTVSAITLSL